MSEVPLRPLPFLRVASTFLLPSSGAQVLGERKLQRIASRGSIRSLFAFLLLLLAGAGSVLAQTTLSVPLGSTSASQSANVTLTSGGTLASIVAYTEGVSNLDFQVTSYNCNPGTSYPAGKVCQIGYTFAPQYAGLRRGGIALENSSGAPLGETYISGIGTGSQSVFYPVFPANIATNTPPAIINAPNYGNNFAVDGAGNLYYMYSEDATGLEAVVKAVRNGNGSYTTSNIYTGGFEDLQGEYITVDGLGNVYFTDAERVVKLTPNNSGYSSSVVVGGSYDWQWLSPIAVDSQGAVYLCFACSTATQESLPTNEYVSETTVAKFTPNGTGGYTQSWVSNNPTVNDASGQNYSGVIDLQIDASGNVFVIGGNGAFTEWAYSQAAKNYSSTDAWQAIDGSNLDQGRGSYESLSLEDDGGFLMYDNGNIYKLIPNGNKYEPQLIYFYCPTCNYPLSSTTFGASPFLREDSQGNIYVQSVAVTFPSGVETLTATIYRLGTSASESLNLGTVQSGGTGSTQSLEITNIGTSAATGNISVEGHFSSETPNPDPYASLTSFYRVLPPLIECNSTFSLPVGGYCAFGVAFSPESSDSGGVSGSVLFTNTNSNTLPSEEVLSLSGTAQHPLPTITSLSSNSGDAVNPTTFTLTGTYLGDVSSVTFTPYGCFGQLTASFSILSTTELQIVAPPDACPGSTATITVTNPGGSATTGWTYNVPPSASNSTLTIATSPIPQNTTTSLTASIKNSSGNPLANDLVMFTSSKTSVATAPTAITNNNGVATTTVTGIFPGTATFTASADGTNVSQTATVTVTAPDVSVGSSQTGLIATLTFTSPGTLGNTLALSQGASNTDFTYDSSTCSAGTAYASGASCKVTYSFNPKAPGLRLGAIAMETISGSVLGTTYVSGIGVGPQAEVFPGVSTSIPTSGEIATNVVTDALGNVYYGGAYTGVYKWSNGVTTSVTDIDVYGLVVDGAGNLLLSTNGFNGTVAGVYELVNGAGAPKTIVTFSNSETPSGNMAFDGLGNLYVPLTNEIGKIAAGTNVMTTIAAPSGAIVSGLAVDSAGDLFFVDNAHGNVDEIAAGGTSVTTVTAGLSNAYGVAVDAAGNLYVSSFNAMQRLAAGTYAQTSLTGLRGYDLSIDSSGTLWMAQLSGVVEENRTAGATLSFSSDVGVEVQQSMTLENDGNSALSVTKMAVSSPFTVDNSTTCSASISLTTANPVCKLVIDFTPSLIGNSTGTAAFTDNTLNSSGTTQSTPLNGTAYGTQTITFPQPTTPVLPNATATLTATASSGLAVTYAITSGPATVTGSTVTYTGTGTVVITASQAGNGSYVAAAPVSVTVVVGGMSEPVGTASPTQSAIITISTNGTLQSINALTKGAANKDYKYVSGSNAANACAIGTAYSANATCTVTYSFTPTLPGQRLGAISLTSSSGAVMGTQFLSGIGTGPVAIFPGKPAISTLVTGLNAPQSTAVDGNGDVFYASQNSSTVNEIVAVNGVVSSSSQVVAVGGGYLGPEYITIDGAGNLFVTENFNNSSNSQNPGTVTEIVAVNGQVSTSSPVKIVCVGLNDPQGVAVDASGDVFVDDYGNNQLKEVVASNGQIPANSTGNVLYAIGGEGLAVDASGDVFIAAANYASIVELVAVNGLVNSSSTIKYFSAGGEEPYDVRLDAAGDLFVADPGSMVPSQIGKGAVVSEIVAINGAVSSSSTVLTLSTAIQARGLAIDGQGHVFVADTNNNDIRELDMTTAPTVAFGSGVVGSVSAAQTTTLENAGNSALTLSALAPSSANFVLDGTSTTCSTGSPLAASGVCTVGADFTPAKSGALTGTINLTDNSNSVAGSEQQIPLTGTGMTGTTNQTITFPQPATPAANGSAPVTLTASASSGLAITYSVVSGPATISGSTLTYTGPGTAVVEADQFGNATYAAAASVQRTITVVNVVSYSAPATTVNTTSATQTATINFTAAGTLGSIDVLTQGTANLDFQQVAGGSCTMGTDYTAGETCTVEYSFKPAAPGARRGAVLLYSNSSTPLLMGTSYLGGTGTGPLALFTNGVQSSTISGLSFATAVTVDGAGDIFYAEQTSGTISEIAAGSTTPTVILSGINTVTGLAIDGAGNLFYGSYGANKVYELVGASGSPQFVANVSSPDVSMAIDTAGNIYVPGNDLVTKIAAGTFAVTTFGVVTGSVPGVTVDASGNVYFSDYSNNTIYEVAAGTTTPVALVTSGLSGPRGLAVDAAGNLYAANQSANNVLRLTAGTWAPRVIATGYGYGSLMMDQYGTLWSGVGSAVVNIARSTAAAAFPSTALGNSNNLAISIDNDGNQPLAISALGASGSGFQEDSALTTCSTTTALAVAGTCNVGATFAPQSAGALTGDIDITDNSLNLAGSLLQAALTGTGTAATPVVQVTPASNTYGLSPTPLTATVTYGGVQPTGTVTIQVDSGATMTANCVAGSGSETCSASYPTSTLTVGIHTITAGIAADANYNAASNTDMLSISQATPAVSITAYTINSGTALSNTQLTGTATSTVNGAAVSVPGAFAFTSAAGTVLGAGGNQSESVTFTPSDTIDYTTATTTVLITVDEAPVFTGGSGVTMTVLTNNTYLIFTAGYPTASITESGALPSGVTFVDNGNGHGTLSGRPAANTGGVYPLTFTASNGIVPNGTLNYTLTIDQPTSITSPGSATFTAGTAGSYMVTTAGYPLPVSFTETGTLPVGVTFVNNGDGTATLSGTPAADAGGTYPLSITANNGKGGATQSFTLNVLMLAYTAPTTNVGTASAPQTATLQFTGSGTLNTINMMTQGAAGLDFQLASGGSCSTGTAYTAGQICTVNYTFNPLHPGLRLGGITLTAVSASNVLATVYLSGIGTGPQATFATPASGIYVPTTETTMGSGFSLPLGVAVDASGNVFVADTGNAAVKEILAAGGYTTINTLGSGFSAPHGVAVDGNGNVFVADYTSNEVKEIVAAGGYTTINSIGSGFNYPFSVAVDGGGNVYVADYGNSEVKEILAVGGYTTVNTLGSGFSYPVGVAVDSSGNVFVVDSRNHALKEILAAGGYTTVNTLHSGFNTPYGVAVDASGNAFVADAGNDTVDEILAVGGYTTINTLGSGFNFEGGVAVDGSGNVFVADYENNRVVKLDYTDPPSLSFASTHQGQTSSDSPQTVIVSNDGNAPLMFPIPASGDDPIMPSGFALDAATTCPQVTASSSAAGMLALGATCNYLVDFIPSTGGTNSGPLTLTDNSLNAVSPNNTQTISVTGLGSAGPVVQLAFTTPPLRNIVAGDSPGTVAVSAEDAGNDLVSGFSATVTLTVTGPNGYSQGYTAATSSGVATFSNLAALSVAGTYTYTATDTPDGLAQGAATEIVVPPFYNAPATNVGAASATQTATLLFTSSGTLNSIAVLTQGTANLDFQLASGGTCAIGTAYTTGQNCTVNYTFNPLHPGLRLGGITLIYGGNVLASAYLSGTGTGPQAMFANTTTGAYLPSAQNTLNTDYYDPYGVAVDGSGNVFFADGYNNVVVEIAAAGGYTSVNHYLGLGGNNSLYSFPSGIAIDGNGNLYVADTGESEVKELTAASSYSIVNILGGGFIGPSAVAVDRSGNVFVADMDRGAVMEIPASCIAGANNASCVQTLMGGFGSLTGIAVDGSGNVFVTDSGYNKVEELVAAGGYTTLLTLNSGFYQPYGVAVDGIGNVFVADYGNSTVNELVAAGDYSTVRTLGNGFYYPQGIAVDVSGNLFVADTGGGSIMQMIYTQPPSLSFASTSVGSTSSDSPQTVTISNVGNAALTFKTLAYPADFRDAGGDPNACSIPKSLPSGQTCDLPIDFSPKTAGGLSEFLTLTDNNLNASPSGTQKLTLTGTALGPPFGHLGSAVDNLTNGTTVGQSDLVVVNGWVADRVDGAPLSNVQVYIDGNPVGTPTLGIARSGVASAYGAAYLDSGYQLRYSAATLALGPHTVTVIAIDSGGRSSTFGPLKFTVALTPPFGRLESAVNSLGGSTTVGQSDSVVIKGWVADPIDGAPLSNVQVYIDGNPVGTPTLGIAQPSVASLDGAAYLDSGYQLRYSAATLALGPHTVTVIAIDSGGRSTTFGPLNFTVSLSPPFGHLGSAVDNLSGSTTVGQSDSVVVHGWVADRVDGAPLSNVQVYIDGNPVGTPTLGIARSGVASAYGAAYLHSGYQLRYSAATLALGPHTVTVIAIDSGGRSTTFGPIKFTVQ